MKTIPFLSLLVPVVLFSSCEDRKDYFALKEGGIIPAVYVYKGDDLVSSLADSLKLDMDAQFPYKIECVDEVELSYKVLTGNYTVSISDSYIKIRSSKEGTGKIEFTGTSALGKTGKLTMELRTFKNLRPLCKATVIPTFNEQTQYIDIEINASESYDKDSKYGGYIVEYKYIIDGIDEPVITNKSRITQVLKSTGKRNIVVSCKDNDGDWSDNVSLIVDIK
jgi:hypothetical protein